MMYDLDDVGPVLGKEHNTLVDIGAVRAVFRREFLHEDGTRNETLFSAHEVCRVRPVVAGAGIVRSVDIHHLQCQLSVAVNAGERTVKANGKSTMMSVSDATFRAMEYETFAKVIQKELADRKNGKDAAHYSNIAEADEPTAYTTNANDAEATQATMPGAPTGEYAGWDSLIGSMGMGGMGDTMQHLGITLSMLPDMLVGVFTGKTRSIGLNKETMMPLAALLTGTYRR